MVQTTLTIDTIFFIIFSNFNLTFKDLRLPTALAMQVLNKRVLVVKSAYDGLFHPQFAKKIQKSFP